MPLLFYFYSVLPKDLLSGNNGADADTECVRVASLSATFEELSNFHGHARVFSENPETVSRIPEFGSGGMTTMLSLQSSLFSTGMSFSASTSTLTQVPPTATSSTKFESIFATALTEYHKQTKYDITSHPLAAQLYSCDSPGAIIAVLRTQVHPFDQSQSADEKCTKWLVPTVHVLCAFSTTLSNRVEPVNCNTLRRFGSTL
jgi:hypothetical protein